MHKEFVFLGNMRNAPISIKPFWIAFAKGLHALWKSRSFFLLSDNVPAHIAAIVSEFSARKTVPVLAFARFRKSSRRFSVSKVKDEAQWGVFRH